MKQYLTETGLVVLLLVQLKLTVCEDHPFNCTTDGFFRDPHDCQLYHKCSDGNDDLFRCPEQTIFDFIKRLCTQSEEVNCTIINETTLHTHTNETTTDSKNLVRFDTCFPTGNYEVHDPTNSSMYHQCYYGIHRIVECPTKSSYNSLAPNSFGDWLCGEEILESSQEQLETEDITSSLNDSENDMPSSHSSSSSLRYESEGSYSLLSTGTRPYWGDHRIKSVFFTDSLIDYAHTFYSSQILIYADEFINSIQLSYIVPDNGGIEIQAARHGGLGGKVHNIFRLDVDERIIRIEGRKGWYIDSIQFTTNKGRTSESYGSNGGSKWIEEKEGHVLGYISGTASGFELTTIQFHWVKEHVLVGAEDFLPNSKARIVTTNSSTTSVRSPQDIFSSLSTTQETGCNWYWKVLVIICISTILLMFVCASLFWMVFFLKKMVCQLEADADKNVACKV